MSRHSFVVNDVIRGFHIYKAIWDPVIGEELGTVREIGNPHNTLAVAVVKSLHGERMTVGHLPRRISPLCSAFLSNGGTIDCTVTGRYQHSADLSQGGLDVPCSMRFAANDEAMCKKLEISIQSSLSESGVEYPDPYALSGTRCGKQLLRR